METYVNDTVQLTVDTNIDVSGYTDLIIKYRKPTGATGCWTAALCPADNNCMTYTTVDGDLDVAGDWVCQPVVESVGSQLHGRWFKFTVHDPLIAACP